MVCYLIWYGILYGMVPYMVWYLIWYGTLYGMVSYMVWYRHITTRPRNGNMLVSKLPLEQDKVMSSKQNMTVSFEYLRGKRLGKYICHVSS